jgi:ABC-type Fe3+ transport system permease subunit
MLASFLYVMVLAFSDISTVIFLSTAQTPLLSITIYNLWTSGAQYPVVAAMGILIMLILATVLLLIWLLAGRTGNAALRAMFRGAQR